MAAESAVVDTDGMTAPISTAVIRQWARDNGLPVGDRGRLSPQLLTAYASSGPAKPDAPGAKIVSTSGRATPRRGPRSVRVPVQPTPGATGIAHKIAARAS
jgi:ATP-dependent DNA helicase PIF1